MKRALSLCVLFVLTASPSFAQSGLPILLTLSTRDTLVSTAADTNLVPLETGYGTPKGPFTVYLWAQKLSDSIHLTVYYDIAFDSPVTGWFTIDSSLVPSDIAGANEIKIQLDTLLSTGVFFREMRCRIVGTTNNDKTLGTQFEIYALADRLR